MVSGIARADESGDIQHCTHAMAGNSEITRERAEYACRNPFYDFQAGDTAQEEEWRLQGIQDQAEAHEDALRLDHEEQENN
jgi:hypothetical protein